MMETRGWNFILSVAALVIFILAAFVLFGVGTFSLGTGLGLVACGLACWIAASIAP